MANTTLASAALCICSSFLIGANNSKKCQANNKNNSKKHQTNSKALKAAQNLKSYLKHLRKALVVFVSLIVLQAPVVFVIMVVLLA